MTFLQGVAVLLLVSGVAIGTLSDRRPPSEAKFENGFWILAADLHVHSFLGDGGLSPWDLLTEARRRQLDVIALTNHNQVFGARVAHWLSRTSGGPMALVGQEISAPDYHLIAIGVNEAIDWRQPAASAIEAIHQRGGIAIAAHPTVEFSAGFDTRSLELLDGAEVAHPVMFHNEERRIELATFYERAKARNARIAPVSGSDMHFLAPVGRYRTYVFTREFSERGVLEAFRHGRTLAADADGHLYGDPALIALFEQQRAGRSPSAEDGWRVSALAAVWAGLLGLVLFGGRGDTTDGSPCPAPPARGGAAYSSPHRSPSRERTGWSVPFRGSIAVKVR
jgi:predicted metal-dependent phosphoesterase TrpH